MNKLKQAIEVLQPDQSAIVLFTHGENFSFELHPIFWTDS